ncbi:MAG: alpha-galactosidase, partial [Abditibacteriota bacterium]|nr:alpha-galactosidase [Abditibacteriota bacterium]
RTTFDIAEEVTAKEVKGAEDGAFVALSEDLIAASDSDALLDNTFVLQNRDRTLGFRGVGVNVKRGDILRDIKAVKSTLPTGETLLTVKSFTAAGTDTVSPLGTKIGASAALTDICVRLWGKVTASDEVSATIDDGSGSAVIDLSKQVTPITHTLSVGDFVSVTGVVYGNTVVPTSDSDLVTRSGEKSNHRTAAAVAESAFSAMSRKAFSFTYDGASSDEFLSTWNRTRSVTTTEDGKVYENVFTDPATGLQLTVKATRYDISPAIEWCMYFKNTSQAKTPIIENILPLDFEAAAASAKLMTSVGNVEGGDINEYMPNISDLTSEPAVFVPGNGRSAFDVMPYFDLIFPTSGIITAVGWSGSWKASFAAARGKAVMKAGQEQCHFYLKPGEEVRTPAVITLFWSGDRDEGHNAFRRLMLNHCTPHGADIDPSASASPYLYDPNAAINVVMGGETEENMLLGINNMLTGGYVPDQWWIDAGWYKCGHWSELGNWYADPTRFPRGMKPVSNRLHENGMKLRLWVAPESAVDTSDAYTQNPQSFFYPKVEGNLGYFLNPGNPNALAWAKETMDNVITSTGCDALGFDVGPGDFRKWWNANEPADRRGINEIKHITGLYELWDYLYERHPNILLDTLGARLDFEAARRTIALWRSDYEYGWSAEGNQNCTYGMSYYLPITGGGNIREDKYYFRSSLGSFWNSMFDYYNSSYTWQFAPVQLELFRSVQHLFRGDYYPISGGENGWMAWQFNRPDLGEGIVQIFRREVAAGNTYTVKFKGLDQSARYLVDNWDAASAMYTGKVLMNTGIRCTRTGTASGVWTYRKVK